jgi:hypothetical protein
MIAMTFAIELSYPLQSALPLAGDRSRDADSSPGPSKRSYGQRWASASAASRAATPVAVAGALSGSCTHGVHLSASSRVVSGRGTTKTVDAANDIAEFLITRRAKITPEQAGLPSYGNRRVPGLRREEVASLAG